MKRAKWLAVQADTSVSGLLTSYLARSVEEHDNYAAAGVRPLARRRVRFPVGAVGNAYAWSREEHEREFVDSHVIVYAHDRSPKSASEQAKALELRERLWLQGNGCISVQVLQECFVTVTRKLVRSLNVDQADALLEDLTAWRVHAPNAADVLAAVRIHREYVISFPGLE